MTNYLEFLNPNRIWSLGTHGQLQYVNISGDLSVNNIITSDISINNVLKATSALIDDALFKNIKVKGDASFNSDIQISGNIISSSGSKGLEGQFLRATISGWDWQYLDASYITDNSFNNEINRIDISLTRLIEDVRDICGSLFLEKIRSISGDLLNLESNLLNVSGDLFNLINTVNNLDISYLTDVSFIELVNNVNNLDSIYLTDISFNNYKTIVDNSFSLLNKNGISQTYVNDVSQTFFEIMTQQPYRFDSSGTPDNANSALINLSWNYDKIMAKNSNNNYVNLVNFDENKKSLLPFINTIKIEISGTAFTMNSGWTDLSTLTIVNNESYNVNKYKQFTLKKFLGTPDPNNITDAILSKLDPFDIKIYGINNGINDPTIDNRALYFRGISFELASAPSTPIFVNENILSNSSLTSTFNITQIEKSNVDSIGILDSYIIDYNANNSLCSVIYPINNIDLSYLDNFTNNYGNNSNFNIVLNSLRAGTSYNYKVKINNNLNKLVYSDYSILRESNYTHIPNSNNINTTIDTNIKTNKVNISSPNFNNLNIIYINLSDNNHILDYNNNSIQIIEISNPYYNNQLNDKYGFGKFIDNVNSLVSISVSIDNELKQTISFDGSFSKTKGNENKHNGNSYNFITLQNKYSLQDIYKNDLINQGFRLKGSFKLEPITNNNIINSIGNASINPYNIKFDYLRDISVNGINNSFNYNIYIDDLSSTPIIIEDKSEIKVLNVLYNMGIPSVENFKLIFERSYNNINSKYLFIPASDNNKIAVINNINNTTANGEKNIILNNNNITTSGNYIFDQNSIQNLTNNYYTNLNYTTKINFDNSNLNWTETAFNLYTSFTKNIELNTNHYCDYNSFKKNNNKIEKSNLDLSNINLYEIININSLGSSINNIIISHYNNHNNIIKDNTLMYIDGLFQGNSSLNYPSISSYNYSPLNINNNYNSGNISYDLSGNNTGLNNNGYKFIVFKISKNPNNSSNNGSYIFNNNIHNVISNNDGYKYLSIKNLLIDFFSLNDLNNLFNINNNDAIGFVRVSLINSNYKRIGNLKQKYNPVGGIWSQNGGLDTNYNNSLRKAYGAKVEYPSINDYGIYIDYSNLNDDLTLFIGLKN